MAIALAATILFISFSCEVLPSESAYSQALMLHQERSLKRSGGTGRLYRYGRNKKWSCTGNCITNEEAMKIASETNDRYVCEEIVDNDG